MKKYLFGIVIISVIACSKDNNPPNLTPPTPVDTLSQGWTYTPLPKPFYATDIIFVNDTVGFVAGNNWICRSNDGGKTWDSVYNKPNTYFISVGMGDANHAIFIKEPPVSGSNSEIIKTDNGGTSFSKVAIADDHISNVYFVSPATVFAVGQKCWKSTDAGSTWTALFDFGAAGLSSYRGLFFLDAQTGWTTAPNGLYKTTNGGINWQPVSSLQFTYSELFFTGATNGFATDSGKFSRSIDGGTTWSSQSNVSTGYHDIHFVSATTGYVTDKNKILKTTDGGLTWKAEVTLASQNLNELHFTDASHGWACINALPGILRFKL